MRPRLLHLPGSALLALGLNAGLWPALAQDVRDRLRGRRVEIRVTDWNASFRFTVGVLGFVPRVRDREPELRILAAARDFGALAAGEADADTLYFNRRLVVEGDTELALLVKNTLDGLEPIRARRLVAGAHRLMLRLRDRESVPKAL